MKLLRFLALYCVLAGTSTIVHETGHVIAGRLIGLRVSEVSIGYTGQTIYHGSIGGIDVSVRTGAFLFDGGHTLFARSSFTAWNFLFFPLVSLAGACSAALYLLGLYRLFFRDRLIEPLRAAFLGPACWPFLAAVRKFLRERRACRAIAMGESPARHKTLMDRLRMFGSAVAQLDPAAVFMMLLFNEGVNLVFIPNGMDGGKAIIVSAAVLSAILGPLLAAVVIASPLIMAFHMRRKRLIMEAAAARPPSDTKPGP